MDYELLGPDWRVGDPLPSWQWLKELPVAIVEENELPAWKSPEQIVKAVRDMGAEHVRYPAICWGAHYFGHSDFLPKAKGIPPDSDYFGDVVRACRKAGIKVMAYNHIGVLYKELEELHPEWLAIGPDGTPEVWNNLHRKVCFCNESFQDAFAGALNEVVTGYHPDSVYIDGPTWYCPECHCESCKSRYREMFGEELPAKLSWADGSAYRYGQLRDEAHLEILKKIHAVTDAAGIPLTINTTMHAYHAHGCGDTVRAMTLYADGANTTEVHRPNRFVEMLLSAKLGEATKKISMAYCPPGPFETLRTYGNIEEASVLGMAYVMHGGTPMLEPASSYFFDNEGGSKLRELCDAIRQHPDIYYRVQPVREIALVYPRQTLERMEPKQAKFYDDCYLGLFEALTNAGIHFDCLYDVQLSGKRLRGYRALIMPCSTGMDEEQLSTVRDYVREGGVLIAGSDCTLYDSFFRRRSDFALADVLGVSFEKENEPGKNLAREYREGSLLHGFSRVPEAYIAPCSLTDKYIPVSDAVVGVPDLQRYIQYMHVNPTSAQILASLYLPADGAFGEPLTFPYGTPPAITVNCYGAGKAYYCAARLGYIYARRGLPDQRNLIKELLHHALGGKLAVELDAPPSLIINLTEDVHNRYLHILNYTGSMLEKSRAIEWIAPVYHIHVNVSVPSPVNDVRLVYPDESIPFSFENGRVSFELEELKTYQSIRFIFSN